MSSAVNRLDRLTSGLMIIPLSPVLAGKLSKEFAGGQVKKEYIARCKGKFPEGEVTCEEPLLTVDRQMGLNIVHPEGKVRTEALSVFIELIEFTLACENRFHTTSLRC